MFLYLSEGAIDVIPLNVFFLGYFSGIEKLRLSNDLESSDPILLYY